MINEGASGHAVTDGNWLFRVMQTHTYKKTYNFLSWLKLSGRKSMCFNKRVFFFLFLIRSFGEWVSRKYITYRTFA